MEKNKKGVINLEKIKRLAIFFGVLTLLSGCISIPTGDGGKIKVSKDGLEVEGEDGEKTSVDVDTEEGGYTIKSDEGQLTQIGSHAEIPENFPGFILIPPKENIIMAVDTSEDGKTSIMLAFEMNGNMDEGTKKYEQYLLDNGYEVETVELGDSMKSYQGNKEDHYLSYQFMDADDHYTLQVMYGER